MMQLNDLSARELALIDSVCLEFETALRDGKPMDVDTAVALYRTEYPGAPSADHVRFLEQELRAIEDELAAASQPPQPNTTWQPVAATRAIGGFGTPTDAGSSAFAASKNAAGGANAAGPSNAADSSFAEPMPTVAAPAMHGDASLTPPYPHPSDPGDANLTSAADGDDSAADNPFAPGQTIGPYRIETVLAHGGMGVVYRAFDTRLDRTVAVKVMGFPDLSPGDPKRRELVERFEREAKAVAALSHPNIVELFDVGVVGSLPYAVMEYLDGPTLADRLRSGAMDAEQTRQIGLQISGALATAHAAGVIHRDLKPHNVILVDASNVGDELGFRVKLVDFGLSRVSDSFLGNQNSDSERTRSGTILGTPGYMSPEQARGQSATGAADMFGLGCLLYEAFFGKPAIPGETPADRLAGTLRGDVTYEKSGCEKSRTLCRLISECLDKDPDHRPTASDVYARLRQFDLRPAPASLASVPQPQCDEPGRFLRRHALAAIAGGVLGGLGGVFSRGTAAIGLDSIRSLAVLTIRPADGAEGDAAGQDEVASGMPLAEKPISDGDLLASALVNELTAVDGLAVMPYRPLCARTPGDFQQLGGELEVDAFLTGTYENTAVGDENFWVFNWELISGKDGRLLAGDRFLTKHPDGDDPLLQRSEVASEVAKRIGRFLVTSGQRTQPPNSHAYGCLAKGHAYADADSIAGLRQAIRCYSKAHEEDPRLSEPLGARAVAALNLAARGNAEDALQNLEVATESMIEALEINPDSITGRLAKAMLEWQRFHHFDDALKVLDELDREAKYNPQVQHQRGLLLAAFGRADEAIDGLRRAAKLNPMSVLVKSDRCRVDWFFNDEPRAIGDAKRYLQSVAEGHPGRLFLVGLLIDLYEHRGDFEKAAQLQAITPIPKTGEDYYQARELTLADFPYGPFGEELNRAILSLRSKPSSADPQLLWTLDESGATMFPLMLARHPAFFALRALPQAADFLPLGAAEDRWS